MEDKKNNKGEERKNDSPENGNNFTTGKPDSSPLPNNPAENAERTSPEEDKAKKKKEQ
jgi:hypothetical protein